MNNTIISSKTAQFLEELIVKHGNIVSSAHIYTQAKRFWDYKQTKNVITKLIKNGWLTRIKRGLYNISDISTRGFLSVSPYATAHFLVNQSYVSFVAALQYHGMFDQLPAQIVSVSTKNFNIVKLQNIEYLFIVTKDKYFFGWQEVSVDGHIAHIATPEKALVDMIHFHRTVSTVDLVIEKLQDYKKELNFSQLNEYALRHSLTTAKIFGLLFDFLKIDSTTILNYLKGKRSMGRMFAENKKFNAKWRLYYDEYFDKYTSS